MRLTLGDLLSLLLGLAIVFTSYSAVSQTTNLALNGIAIHSEFGQPQFMAALYSSAPSSNTAALYVAPAMRMELKILTADGLPLRRFSRMWIEAVSLNNDAKLLTAQAANMVLFDSLFKDRLQRNDTLSINYRQGKGVAISLNQVALTTVSDDKFFALLVRSWIGDVPLSSNFKNDLLKAGLVATDLKSRFESIKPSPERSQEIKKWLASGKKNNEKPMAKVTAAVSSQAVATKTQMGNQGSEKPAAASMAVASQPSAIITEISTAAASSSLAQTLLARQYYISQLLKKIRSNTRYPQRANQLGQSDSLRIAVIIDRRGNIIKLGFIQGSRYAQLNEAALTAIKKSAPLLQMPELLTEPTFEFTVPINFVASNQANSRTTEAQQSLSARALP